MRKMVGRLRTDWFDTMQEKRSREIDWQETPERYESLSLQSFDFSPLEFFEADTYIVSINGVVESVVDVRGEVPSKTLQQQIVECINRLIDQGKRILFVSNDSRRSRQQ